jgi:hypothetical protein
MTDTLEGGTAPSLSARSARLAEQLHGRPNRTVRLPELWVAWDAADPASAGRPERRADLAASLLELELAGLISQSSTQDRSARPPLPTRVTLAAEESTTSAAAMARGVAWRPELAWVLSTRLTVAQVTQLRAVNTWLRDHSHETDELPMRERSLQVLGHEKALERLLGTGVFAPGRLTLAHLRTFRTHPPLPHVKVGDGPVLLVAENDDTFNSLLTVLRSAPGPVGRVAWGAGGAFEASVRSTGDLAGIERVAYFGDLDADGLRIPLNASATAVTLNLPPVRPATALYRRLLETAVRQPGQPSVPTEQATRLSTWLEAEDLRAGASQLLCDGIRIPQEALTVVDLAADVRWAQGL